MNSECGEMVVLYPSSMRACFVGASASAVRGGDDARGTRCCARTKGTTTAVALVAAAVVMVMPHGAVALPSLSLPELPAVQLPTLGADPQKDDDKGLSEDDKGKISDLEQRMIQRAREKAARTERK